MSVLLDQLLPAGKVMTRGYPWLTSAQFLRSVGSRYSPRSSPIDDNDTSSQVTPDSR